MNEILWPLVALYLIVVVVATVVLVSSSGVFLGANRSEAEALSSIFQPPTSGKVAARKKHRATENRLSG